MKKIVQLLREERKKAKKKPPFLVSVSGGQDSILTFFLFLHGFGPKCFDIVYYHHFWQPKNFFSVHLLFKLSFLFQISCTVIVPTNPLVTENLSRRWRRKNVYRLGEFLNIQTLIGGQTKTDTTEKNISKILRGTTPHGLSEKFLVDVEATRSAFFSVFRHKIPFLETKSSASLVVTPDAQVSQPKLMVFGVKTVMRGKLLLSLSKIHFVEQQRKRSCRALKKKNQVKNFQFFTKREKVRVKNGIHCEKCLIFHITHFSQSEYSVFRSKLESMSQQKTRTDVSMSCSLYSQCKTLPVTRWNPIETLHRSSISKIVTFYTLPLIQDTTNFSTHFLRNKIRHTLVPYLRFHFNSQFEKRLDKFLHKVESTKAEPQQKILTNLLCLKMTSFFQTVRMKERNLCEVEEREAKTRQKSKFHSCTTPFCIPQLVFSARKKSEIESILIQKLFFRYKNVDLNSVQNDFLQHALFQDIFT